MAQKVLWCRAFKIKKIEPNNTLESFFIRTILRYKYLIIYLNRAHVALLKNVFFDDLSN